MEGKKVIIVSPHIDDAILSMGGSISKLVAAGSQVSIVNVFSISSWTHPDALYAKDHGAGDRERVTEIRKAEEMALSRQLNYRPFFLDFLDLPIRDQAMTDAVLSERIKCAIRDQLDFSSNIFFPLGIDHPDHCVVRNIGNELMPEGYRISFYEDLPYVARKLGSGALVKSKALEQGLRSSAVEIDISKKIASVKAYESQVSEEWLTDLYDYSSNTEGTGYFEYFWSESRHSDPVDLVS